MSAIHGAIDDVFRHCPVHLAGELDEAGVDAVFARFPSEIERIDGDAVTAEAGARIEGGEAEGLGGGGADDFPDVDVHRVGDDLEFVDDADIDRAVDIFEQLGEFRDLGGGDRHHLVERSAVERDSLPPAGGRVASDDFGDVGGGELWISGIFALGGIDDENGLAGNETSGFDARDNFLVGGAGVGGAFEAENGAGFEIRTHCIESVADVGEIGFEW